MGGNQMGFVPIFRPEMGYTDIEKRQLFLRSYQFSRKQSISEKIKKSFFRVKRGVIWVRLRSVRIRKFVWFRLKHGLFYSTTKTRWFLSLQNNTKTSNCPYPCFW